MRYIYLLFFICGNFSAAIVENFQNYDSATFLAATEWREQAYGKHPSAILTEENGVKFMQGAGSGDRRVYRHLPKNELMEILNKKVIVYEFKGKRNLSSEIGVLGKYTHKQRFKIQLRNKINLAFADNNYQGIVNIDTSNWNTYRIILEKDAENILASAFFQTGDTMEFQLDPTLNRVKFPAAQFKFDSWNGVGFRIDGTASLMEFSFKGYDSISEVPGLSTESASIKPPMYAILDHIASPRSAIDLSGLWSYAINDPQKTNPIWQPVKVPDYHRTLMATARKNSVLFKTEFSLDNYREDKRYWLKFERATHRTIVHLNSQTAGESNQGHFPFAMDVSPYLKTGKNELVVEVFGPMAIDNILTDWPQGWRWFYPAFAGIPYPVHLETTGEVLIRDVFVKPLNAGKEASELVVEISVANLGKIPQTVSLEGRVADEWIQNTENITIQPGEERIVVLKKSWKKPRLWWPHDPYLYKLELNIPGIDAYVQEFGFREITINKHQMLLNGVPFMHRRASPIIYWYHADSPEKLRDYYQLLKSYGINGVRLHSSANLRAIREADRFGMLISPESGMNEPRAHAVSSEYWINAENHLRTFVKTYRNHPSVIYWSLSNEFAGFYARGTVAEKSVIDAKMMKFGNMVSELDPTRTWTASGDGSLGGGSGKDGPAPTLSFHYAWQPFKSSNMIPNTTYWLEEKLRPWQGIVWDKSKPLMLSEDMYVEYCLKPPRGMAWYAGNSAYDIYNGGALRAWHDACRMLADGYYFSEVTVWNPWATAPNMPDNPLYALGQLTPDWHIAIHKFNTTFSGNTEYTLPIHCYNQTFEKYPVKFSSCLTIDGQSLQTQNFDHLSLPGQRFDFNLKLKTPQVSQKQKAQLILNITDSSGNKLTEKITNITIYPPLRKFNAPSQSCIYDPADRIPKEANCDLGRYRNLKDALAQAPRNLIVYAEKITAEEGKMLENEVRRGMNLLIFELSPESWKPIPCSNGGKAAFAFVRAPYDPAMKNIDNGDLKLWGLENHSTNNTIPKPVSGAYDILVDCGNGLNQAAIIRLYRGSGSILLCQMPVISQYKNEPAAAYILHELIARLNYTPHKPSRNLNIVADSEGKITNALKSLGCKFDQNKSSSLIMANGNTLWSRDEFNILKNCLKNNGTVIVNELTPDNLAFIRELTGENIELKESTEWVFNIVACPETDGISNDDLLWLKQPYNAFKRFYDENLRKRIFKTQESPQVKYLIESSNGQPLIYPNAMTVWRLNPGKLIINNLLWIDYVSTKKTAVNRFIRTLLHNEKAIISPDSTLPVYSVISLAKLMNRGFIAPGWFGDANDDMRYFPVNVTGIDPVNKLPQPKEPFPDGKQNYGGIDFELVDPDRNNAMSCLILTAGQTVNIPVNSMLNTAWFLGAAGQMLKSEQEALQIKWQYSDNTSSVQTARGAVEFNGYHQTSVAEAGHIGWTGYTPSRSDAVLWVWPQHNPFPGKPVKSITLKAVVPMAVIAVSAEQ